MKTITITNFVKWQNTSRPRELSLKIENHYRNGYWNVFNWEQELEDFLFANDISYNVQES